MLKHVFDIDIEKCAFGGKLKFTAVIEQPDVIEKIRMHLGLAALARPVCVCCNKLQTKSYSKHCVPAGVCALCGVGCAGICVPCRVGHTGPEFDCLHRSR